MTELTQPFTLTRLQVALASAEEYVRALWWILIPVPIFGVLALLQAPNDLIRGIGTICLVWPLHPHPRRHRERKGGSDLRTANRLRGGRRMAVPGRKIRPGNQAPSLAGLEREAQPWDLANQDSAALRLVRPCGGGDPWSLPGAC